MHSDMSDIIGHFLIASHVNKHIIIAAFVSVVRHFSKLHYKPVQ
jgi:hypothetical protein